MVELNNEQEMLIRSLKDLAKNEFTDRAYEWQGDYPRENIKTLAEYGFMGLNFPEEYGGGGMSEFEIVLMIDILGSVCPDTAEVIQSQHLVGPRAIDMFGSDSAKEKYLPGVIDGEDCIAIAMSEPEAGSDLKSMNTIVEEIDGKLILNGEKTWVSFVPESSAAVVWVKFPESMGTVVVDLDQPGVEVANHFTNMAGHKQTQFYMEDIEVPEENILTRGEDAFKQQLKALNWERVASGVFATSVAQSAVEKAFDYAQDRTQFDTKISDFQGIEWKLADMVTKTRMSQIYNYRTAREANKHGRVPDPLDSTISALYSTVIANEVVDDALQIHGANGYQQGHELEYLYRFIRGYRIAAGTDEILRNTIASLLKQRGIPSLI